MSIKQIQFLSITVVLLLAAGCGGSTPPETAKPANTTTVDADNTARNVRDENKVAPLPLDQSEEKGDIEITANIRKAIVADKSLSSNAKNVKIVTSGGEVALRGPVKNANEKMTIEAKAKEVAGSEHVHSLLEIETQP